MGQVRHGSATTTHAVRAALQRSTAELSREIGITPKTVAEWRKRRSVEDRKTGLKEPRSTVLSGGEEAMIVAFRRHTLLPFDDCLYALQALPPDLTRASLHRCLQRHGISRLPDMDGTRPNGRSSSATPLASFTSISPRSGRKKASSICLSPLTEPASSRWRSRWTRPTAKRLGNSRSTFWRPRHTAFTRS